VLCALADDEMTCQCWIEVDADERTTPRVFGRLAADSVLLVFVMVRSQRTVSCQGIYA
jgi:hypothetical protein